MRVAILAARGGSKGLPGKNIRHLGGIPLIEWTVRAARAADIFDRIILTTDDNEIAGVGRRCGVEVPFQRPDDLATDASETSDVVEHVVDALGLPDSAKIALLQPTTPFRSAHHIREAAELWQTSPVVSVTKGKPLSWSFLMDKALTLTHAVPSGDAQRRQHGPVVVIPNGGLYLTDVATFCATRSFFAAGTRGYFMGAIDSIDIDTAEDFEMAEVINSAGLREPDAQ